MGGVFFTCSVLHFVDTETREASEQCQPIRCPSSTSQRPQVIVMYCITDWKLREKMWCTRDFSKEKKIFCLLYALMKTLHLPTFVNIYGMHLVLLTVFLLRWH